MTSAARRCTEPSDYAPARGLHRIVLMTEPSDPPMPHELRFAWAERMRQYEAAQSEAPAEDDGTNPA